jgi:uncharacterized protein YtpQ (UPF0354 family)
MHALAPDLRIRVTGALTLEVDAAPRDPDPEQVSLQRLWTICRDDPASCEPEVDHFLAVIARIASTTPQLPERAQILPELRPRAYVDAMGALATDVVVQPFVDDLVVLYVVDSLDSTRALTTADLRALRLSAAEVAAIARENLARRLAPLPFAVDEISAGDPHMVTTGNFYESSRLLLDADWEVLASRAPAPMVVGVPENDFIVFVAGIDGEQLANVRAAVREGYDEAARPVSPHLYRWDAGRWVLFP